ncbi:hypothetical protein BDK51DRAFT_52640 [Blyttiomyces helicus]|uniref:Uncharacterized protein n=1 Tax=Blyttiomyces helicus TaxID=388810 RepID=A0A4V1IRD6_9FUNG|nr:hypothetical protein BDK51DRAFT_52640 [Blyttiomyces helicus]|eukprot:RKO89687.1 hypothetical protein BDK51DRAFT_52640 [Blyttiomyces helicus]
MPYRQTEALPIDVAPTDLVDGETAEIPLLADIITTTDIHRDDLAVDREVLDDRCCNAGLSVDDCDPSVERAYGCVVPVDDGVDGRGFPVVDPCCDDGLLMILLVLMIRYLLLIERVILTALLMIEVVMTTLLMTSPVADDQVDLPVDLQILGDNRAGLAGRWDSDLDRCAVEDEVDGGLQVPVALVGWGGDRDGSVGDGAGGGDVLHGLLMMDVRMLLAMSYVLANDPGCTVRHPVADGVGTVDDSDDDRAAVDILEGRGCTDRRCMLRMALSHSWLYWRGVVADGGRHVVGDPGDDRGAVAGVYADGSLQATAVVDDDPGIVDRQICRLTLVTLEVTSLSLIRRFMLFARAAGYLSGDAEVDGVCDGGDRPVADPCCGGTSADYRVDDDAVGGKPEELPVADRAVLGWLRGLPVVSVGDGLAGVDVYPAGVCDVGDIVSDVLASGCGDPVVLQIVAAAGSCDAAEVVLNGDVPGCGLDHR